MLEESQAKAPEHSERSRRSLFARVVLSASIIFGSVFAFVATQVIAAIVVGGTIGGVLRLDAGKIEELLSENAVILGVYVVSSLLLVGVLMIVSLLAQRNFLRVIGLQRKPQWIDIAWAALGYVGYFIVFAILAVAILPLFQDVIDVNQAQDLGVELEFTLINALVLFVMFVVIPPIIEEVLFRGFMYRLVRNLMPRWLAISLVSIVFGAMHLEFFSDNPLNWVAMIDTTILSVALILAVEKTNSLWPAIYIHAIKNFVAYTLLITGIVG